jgi:hypothetical protein
VFGIYVRYSGPATVVGGLKGPRPDAADWPCVACGKPIPAGAMTVLVPVGPGDDEEGREKARTGRYYNAVAVEVHQVCATGEGQA